MEAFKNSPPQGENKAYVSIFTPTSHNQDDASQLVTSSHLERFKRAQHKAKEKKAKLETKWKQPKALHTRKTTTKASFNQALEELAEISNNKL